MSRIKQFLEVFRRRWQLFVVVLLVALVALLYNYRPNLVVYRSEIRFMIAQTPLDSTVDREEERYYNWVASEYIVYGVKDYVEGTRFAEQVSGVLSQMGQGELDTEKVDQIVSSAAIRSRLIVAVADTEEQVVRDVSAVILELLSNPAVTADLEIPQLDRQAAQISPIDTELYFQELDLRSDAISGAIPRIMASIAIAFVAIAIAELLDPTIRSRDGVELLNLEVLAEIPAV